ncbi:MAG: hypothetical protein ACTHWZ_02070 [Peptoniphilaceae bacterium]
MKIIISLFKILLLILLATVLSMGLFSLLSFIQIKLFLTEGSELLIFKSPYDKLIFIYIYLITYKLFSIFSKNLKFNSITHKFLTKPLYFISFIVINIILIYTIIINVTLVKENSIIYYSNLNPQGIEYKLADIKEIKTGVYGKKGLNHQKGEFYYIISFKDENKINLNNVISTRNNIDHRFVIEDLDKKYVNLGLYKKSSMDNFKYLEEQLDKKYTDRIKSILQNVKE